MAAMGSTRAGATGSEPLGRVFYNGTRTKKTLRSTRRMTKSDIQRHDKKLKTLTEELGRRANLYQKFMCPILFLNEKTELCKGHIVPRSAGGTDWVVQRKDVDNFFGSFAEADFAHGLKLRALANWNDMLNYASKQKIDRKVRLTAIGKNGSVGRINATHLGLRYDETGMQDKDVPVDGPLVFDLSMEFPTIVTALHAVHLGLFNLSGYTYAAGKTGQLIGFAVLGCLFREYKRSISAGRRMMVSEDDADLHPILEICRNLVRPVPQGAIPLSDAVLENPFKDFHVCWNGNRPFATIHYLKFGDECYAVLVPSSFDESSAALLCSMVPLSFTVGRGKFCGDRIEVGLHKTDAVWSCGNSAGNNTVPLSAAAGEMKNVMNRSAER